MKHTQSIKTNSQKSGIRLDLELIANLIEDNSKVLDIGCGGGELLKYLKENKNIDGRGLELSQKSVSKAVSKGISAMQGNAETDLIHYANQSFDYAILSQTLQAMHEPKETIKQMLRIAKFAVISLPNFAYYQNRLQLLSLGTMPKSKTLPYQWYETPNIHFCSIKDFENLCKEMNCVINKQIFLTSKGEVQNPLTTIFANFFAQYGIFLISRSDTLINGEVSFIDKLKGSLKENLATLCMKNHR
jgi:methionine biosynthesis protein MetW